MEVVRKDEAADESPDCLRHYLQGDHMVNNLNTLLIKLTMTPRHRYTLEEVGEVLGISRDEVLRQIKRGHLVAVKVAERKWGYVLHDDLDAFLSALNGGGK